MSVRWHCYLACTQCNNQFYGQEYKQFIVAESAKEVRSTAKAEGWRRIRVPNGSMWDMCPRCYRAHCE